MELARDVGRVKVGRVEGITIVKHVVLYIAFAAPTFPLPISLLKQPARAETAGRDSRAAGRSGAPERERSDRKTSR